MNLLAIASPKRFPFRIPTLEIAITWTASGSALVVQGAVQGIHGQQSHIDFYFLGNIKEAYKISQPELPRIKIIQRQLYSVLRIPIRIPKSGANIAQIGFFIRLPDQNRIGSNIETKIYLGDSAVSRNLNAGKVWSRVIPVDILTLWLFYPPSYSHKPIEPRPRSITPQLKANISTIFDSYLTVRGLSLVSWEKRFLSRINPFECLVGNRLVPGKTTSIPNEMPQSLSTLGKSSKELDAQKNHLHLLSWLSPKTQFSTEF